MAGVMPLKSLPEDEQEARLKNVATTRVRGYPVLSSDGSDLGTVDDLWVDAHERLVRYLALDPSGGRELIYRQLVLLPKALWHIDQARGVILTRVTEEQVRTAPVLAAGVAPTLNLEEEVSAHFRLPPYWEHLARVTPATGGTEPEAAREREA